MTFSQSNIPLGLEVHSAWLELHRFHGATQSGWTIPLVSQLDVHLQLDVSATPWNVHRFCPEPTGRKARWYCSPPCSCWWYSAISECWFYALSKAFHQSTFASILQPRNLTKYRTHTGTQARSSFLQLSTKITQCTTFHLSDLHCTFLISVGSNFSFSCSTSAKYDRASSSVFKSDTAHWAVSNASANAIRNLFI